VSQSGRGSVFLLSDFGNTDEFAGVLRAVVAREAPGAPVVDLTHEIPSFDVRAGALALERLVFHLGPGVLVAVVDPGVGTHRRAVAISVSSATGPEFLVGPDNGLLSFALDALNGATAAVELQSPALPADVGGTFDGRDVFAPAGARLWAGAKLDELGTPIDPAGLVQLTRPRLDVAPGRLETEVLWVDTFGNVQLSARPADKRHARLGVRVEVVTGERRFEAVEAENFALADTLGLIGDSNGRLALVSDRRPAATVLGVKAGDVIELRDKA
jgi:S-adenosylmethionine hydrolase